jgi:hypothetical protein
MIAMLAAASAVGLVVYGWQRSDLRRIIRDFARATHDFNGPLEPCLVRFPLDETRTIA